MPSQFLRLLSALAKRERAQLALRLYRRDFKLTCRRFQEYRDKCFWVSGGEPWGDVKNSRELKLGTVRLVGLRGAASYSRALRDLGVYGIVLRNRLKTFGDSPICTLLDHELEGPERAESCGRSGE